MLLALIIGLFLPLAILSWCLLIAASTPVPQVPQKDPTLHRDQYTRERRHGLIEIQKVSATQYTRDLLPRKD